MKRILSILLILCLMVSANTIAFAEEENLKGTEALAYYTEHLNDPDIDAFEDRGFVRITFRHIPGAVDRHQL